MGILDNEKVNVPCSNCKRKLLVTIGQMRRKSIITCPKCGEQNELGIKGDNPDKIDKQVRDLQKNINDLSKKLKFNIKL